MGGCDIQFCVLSSGSKGNAIWVEADNRAILVDAGLSGKEIKRRIAHAGLDSSRLEALLVTHEHRDHIHGVGILARAFHLPVHMNSATYQSVKSYLGKIHHLPFRTGEDFSLGPFRIHPFSTSHDAADPVGFTFESNGFRLGLATDLGVGTALVRNYLKDCQGLILESNHDPRMLMEGPYPWDLKQRVRGRKGHLSNEDAADLLAYLSHRDLSQVVLAHLSETNNLPDLALEGARTVLKSRPSCALTVARQDRPTGLIRL